MWRYAVRRLPTGSFAFVMATGILSTALNVVGRPVASVVLVVIAIVALGVLMLLTLARLVLFRAELMLDARDPKRAFGFFTIVAAINVVGVRLYAPAAPAATIVLAAVSVPVWLLCTYGLPSNLMLRPRTGPVAADIDGSWFLWTVGTQSVAIAAAVLAKGSGSVPLADIAISLWGIGVVLYLMLSTLVTLRLLTVPNRPHSFTPSYWIYMGATAITVLAGSRILEFDQQLPIMRVTAPFVSGMTYVLWGFGVWWVPLLIIFGLWRHVINREKLRYDSGLWSIVFPLGMYSVASMHFGGVNHLPGLVVIGEIGTWTAAAAWLLVTAGMVFAAMRRLAVGRGA